MSQSLYEIIKLAREELRGRAKDNKDETEPHDSIHEIADSSVPVYTGDLLQLAADNLELATAKPELGPAFDGSPTPVNIVAANVFEAIEAGLWEEWKEIESEREDAELEETG
ncbi:hypothetical protein LCGC14_2787120 [marine sediment metagenome]|uniref:Uncharacterized protein n=1 Tax=marine sediment metagenome TaxID=412755 RepID=A0A0F8ZDN8_9ZZZZ